LLRVLAAAVVAIIASTVYLEDQQAQELVIEKAESDKPSLAVQTAAAAVVVVVVGRVASEVQPIILAENLLDVAESLDQTQDL
jgi:hypothetical protein